MKQIQLSGCWQVVYFVWFCSRHQIHQIVYTSEQKMSEVLTSCNYKAHTWISGLFVFSPVEKTNKCKLQMRVNETRCLHFSQASGASLMGIIEIWGAIHLDKPIFYPVIPSVQVKHMHAFIIVCSMCCLPIPSSDILSVACTIYCEVLKKH